MKEMIRRVREEKGGFTLAELLIVVAIILILVAIAVPVFLGALGNANNAVNEANKRAIKGEATADYLLGDKTTPRTFYVTDSGDVTSGSTAPSGNHRTYTVTISGTGNDVKVTVEEVTEG